MRGTPSPSPRLPAQRADEETHLVRDGLLILRAPELFRDLPVREYAPGIARQQSEQHLSCLGCRSISRPLTRASCASLSSRQRADDDRRFVGHRGERRPVANRHTNPSEQLGHRERLRHVVVGPLVERLHHAILAAVRGHDDDRALRPEPKVATQNEPVHVGQPEIDDHGIGLVPRQTNSSALPCSRRHDRKVPEP